MTAEAILVLLVLSADGQSLERTQAPMPSLVRCEGIAATLNTDAVDDDFQGRPYDIAEAWCEPIEPSQERDSSSERTGEN